MLFPVRASIKRKYFAFWIFLMVQYYVFFCVSRCRSGVGPPREKIPLENNNKQQQKRQKTTKNNEKTTKKQQKNNRKTTTGKITGF